MLLVGAIGGRVAGAREAVPGVGSADPLVVVDASATTRDDERLSVDHDLLLPAHSSIVARAWALSSTGFGTEMVLPCRIVPPRLLQDPVTSDPAVALPATPSTAKNPISPHTRRWKIPRLTSNQDSYTRAIAKSSLTKRATHQWCLFQVVFLPSGRIPRSTYGLSFLTIRPTITQRTGPSDYEFFRLRPRRRPTSSATCYRKISVPCSNRRDLP